MKRSRVGGRPAVYAPGHPAANNRGYVLRARFVVEKSLGRLLCDGETVHHKNHDIEDDTLSNLEVKSRQAHGSLHGREGRRLDYNLISDLRAEGLGYKKIAQATGYPRESIRDAIKSIKKFGS